MTDQSKSSVSPSQGRFPGTDAFLDTHVNARKFQSRK